VGIMEVPVITGMTPEEITDPVAVVMKEVAVVGGQITVLRGLEVETTTGGERRGAGDPAGTRTRDRVDTDPLLGPTAPPTNR